MLRTVMFGSLACLAISTPAFAQMQTSTPALTAAQSLADMYMRAFEQHDAKAISMLFDPDGVFLPPNGDPMVKGREAIERLWADAFKNVGGHETVRVKDAFAVNDATVVAIDEFRIVGDGPSVKVISGRFSAVIAKTPDGWRYLLVTPQTQQSPMQRASH